MKKIALMLALVVVANIAVAQSLNVTSAREAEHRGYLDKAKKLIDPACENEQTMNDAKTWYYAALIYSRIGAEQTNPRSKYKGLDPNWLEKCKNAALRCKELDTDKEYADGNNTILGFAGNEYYMKAIELWNEQKYEECMTTCEESVKLFNESAKKEFADQAYLLAGKAAYYAKNTEACQKYFKTLVRHKTKDNFVYTTLFNMYKNAGDTNEAIKTAQNYVKFCPEDYKANLMMAQAYLIKGNLEQGTEEINKAVTMTASNPSVNAEVLALAGATYESVNNLTEAENNYKKSLAISNNQFVANFGLGKMFYNHAVDKLSIVTDDFDLMAQYEEEAKGFFRQAIPYLNNAISFIDNLSSDAQKANRQNLYACLNALSTIYARLEMYDDLKPIKARIESIEKNAQ